MNEKLILLEDVASLGSAGDTVSVSNGYARNFLIPKKLALIASKGAMRQLQARMEKIEAKRKLDIEQAQAIAEKVSKAELTIRMKAGEDDQLFGSVTTHAIAAEFEKNGLKVDHQMIVLETPIKALGAFDITVKLHAEIKAQARVWVVRD